MTKLASLLLGLTLVVTPAIAQQEEYEITTLLLAHDCAPAERIIPLLREEWGELPFALGTAVVTLKDGQQAIGVLMMNVNPSTLSYTINILFPDDDMMCMLVNGEDFQPAQSRSGTRL